jgi:2,4-dienoyl-CoA reductase-like NADH-dependent reductase (Old Yellow Enzyme family)
MPASTMIEQPFTLPCGVTLPNRLAKAAMTEGLANAEHLATPRLANLYRRWSEGGIGLSLTGNVMIEHSVLENPANVVIDPTRPHTVSTEARERLRAWAQAGSVAGNALWMQISHAGRQSPRYVTQRPRGPSAVQLDLMGNYATPVALTRAEIAELVQRFAQVAVIARDCGFGGVQIHSAHGYLLSSFLSPLTNRREDEYGGSIDNRARFLIQTLRAVRQAVGADYPISVKLNSDDFRKGGFSHEDCLKVVELLNPETLDLLEISGGTYEQPRLLGMEGKPDTVVPVRASTRLREAYFLSYAEAIRQLARMPLMVTGGFRSGAGMDQALSDGVCDVIGIARPTCTHPDSPKQLLAGSISTLPSFETSLHLAERGWRSPTSPYTLMRVINVLGGQQWYYENIHRLADNLPPKLDRGMLTAFAMFWRNELWRALRMRRG